MIEFEFDPQKSRSNQEKHGLDFEEAQKLWQDEDRLLVPAKVKDEPRYALIAKYKEKIWSAFYTTRGEKIRLISVRKSRKEERDLYESQRPR